jgi:hypothetical protein
MVPAAAVAGVANKEVDSKEVGSHTEEVAISSRAVTKAAEVVASMLAAAAAPIRVAIRAVSNRSDEDTPRKHFDLVAMVRTSHRGSGTGYTLDLRYEQDCYFLGASRNHPGHCP